MVVDDSSRLYRTKVLEPGTWPNTGASAPVLSEKSQAVVEGWVEGWDPRCGLVIEGGTAPQREGLGIEVVRRIKSHDGTPDEGFVWAEYDFADNYRMLRSLEDFAKKDRDVDTWNLYVEYERKFYRLLSRPLLFMQGLGENRTVYDTQREFLHHEVVRRLTQTQYDEPRLTVISTPRLAAYESSHPSFYEYLRDYCAIVRLDGAVGGEHGEG